MAAEARPSEATLTLPVQALALVDGLAVTVRVAGVVPEVGDTERKLPQVVSLMVTVNGEAPAVLAT